MKARDILSQKGNTVITTTVDTPVSQAVSLFSDKRIGSLLVVDDQGTIKGILAPNDVLKIVTGDACRLNEHRVGEIMTAKLIVAGEDDDVQYLQAVMTENRIRHLPIMEGPQLKGLISIGDIVKAQLTEMHVENKYLKDYIEGKYPG
jgi:CBS domain-containing protein